MQTIANNDIPLLFSAYCINIGEGYNEAEGKFQRVVRRSQYWCGKCKTTFIVDHNYHGGIGNYSGFSDNITYCPTCGTRHESWWRGPRYIYYFESYPRHKLEEAAPITVAISLLEGKDVLTLRAKFRTLQFRDIEDDDTRYTVRIGERREEFRFNVRHRTAEFIVRSGKGNAPILRYAIGNPFDTSLFEDSLLQQIDSSNHSEECRTGTINIMKTLRERIRKKWKHIHGHDIGSVYASYGRYYGRMLFPLFNIAYRLTYADTPNLPGWFNTLNQTRRGALAERLITKEAAEKFGNLEKIREAKDSVSAIIGLFCLPDKPAVRHLLSMDIFTASELSEVFKLTDSIDYAKALWHLMQDKSREWEYQGQRSLDLPKMYEFLQELSKHYHIRNILAHIRRAGWSDLMDTHRMLERLLPERKETLWQEHVKLKDLHDWLVQALNHQREDGFDLKVPEHVRRRLTMQLDQLRFYLPEHSKELVQIGDKLHNCVRTYDNRMRAQKCAIVPVTDDNGKLVACLEVNGNYLVQAKLKHNVPVCKDAGLNQAIIRWCQKTGLEVRTSDVRKDCPVPAQAAGQEMLMLPMPQAAVV